MMNGFLLCLISDSCTIYDMLKRFHVHFKFPILRGFKENDRKSKMHDFKAPLARQYEKLHVCFFEQCRSISAYASAKSDQDLHFWTY